MPKKVTLADIAQESDVSVATVSLVLRNSGDISPETRKRVLDTAKDLGYRFKKSRATKKNSAPGNLQNLGVIIKSDAGLSPQANPFYSHILSGIEDACRQSKINLLYAILPVDCENRPVETPRLLEEDTIDGLLLVGAFVDEPLSALLEQRSVPVVLVDAYAVSDEYDAVVSDNVRGAYDAVSYLIAQGHRDIGVVGCLPVGYPSLCQRLQGYTQALADNDISQTYIADSTLEPDDAAQVTTELLAHHPDITAIFGCNDEVSLAVMRAAIEMGRRVPEDLSIIGFDDIALAGYVMPPLTTMHVDKASMGRVAVQTLRNRLAFPDSALVTTFLHPRLVERESVAPLQL